MSLERIRQLCARFRERVKAGSAQTAPSMPWSGSADTGRALLESMLLARHLDRVAHELRRLGHGHYTICSSGHEGNVVLGHLTRPGDPALVHYRSAALQIERARQVPGVDAVRNIAFSLVASSEEPTSGGRHKVFGDKRLGIIPQTSTIASHLPRAVGLAFALERRARLGLEPASSADAIALVSFGDATINHSTALGAFNAAGWVRQQRLTLPLLFVCEDNGLGISVRSPSGWVETRLRSLPHVEYFAADGWNLEASYRAAERAVNHCRDKRRPAVLHLTCVRLLGHAGSDVDTVYRSPAEIEAAERRDPVLCAAFDLMRAGVLAADQILTLDDAASQRVEAAAEQAIASPRLTTRDAVMAPITQPVEIGFRPPVVAQPHDAMTLAQGINAALSEALELHPEALLFGEDVAKKGGVYGVTKGLLQRFGPARVFNTLLDEQTILGLALGTATLGFLPIPELQYLAYLHNAEDQLRGEAATLPFFSNGAYDNPMLVRIAGLAYQAGFGGHFHNDNSLAVLRDIPGLVVIVPARADDALELYRTAFALAARARRVVVAIEPIALYHQRDLRDTDAGWLAATGTTAAPFGRARVYHPDAGDLVIATYGNGLFLSLRAAERLAREHGVLARVLDLRFISPLPVADVLEHAQKVGKLLVADECRRSGSPSEALAAAVLDAGSKISFSRVTGADSFVPLGDAARLVLMGEQEIVDAALRLTQRV
jgi:2-oxoisovalerate dehydrogenase E1 component